MSAKHGWTNWDAESMAVWEHLPSGLRARLVLEDEEGNTLTPRDWAPLEDFLPDDGGHSLSHLLLTAGHSQVEVECGGEGDVAACRIADVHGAPVQAHWVIEGTREGWEVVDDGVNLAVAPEGVAVPDDIDAFLRTQREAARLAAPTGEGLLAEPLEAMEAAAAANTFMLPGTEEVVTLSRHIAASAGGWRLPNWESFLTATGIALIDPALALANARTALSRLTVGDRLAAFATADGPDSLFTNPPVAAHAIWKLYLLTGDDSLVTEAFPTLLAFHRWWAANRDPNHNGLVSPASDIEAGMPGHPLYTDTACDEKSGLLMLDDVGLTSLLALDAYILMRMAVQLNDYDTTTALEAEMRGLIDRINVEFWDQNAGLYHSLDNALQSVGATSATMLLSLVGGIPTGIRAHRLVTEHLEAEFDTSFLVPTLAVSDPEFAKQLAWRGRVSPLLNTLICDGLRRYREDMAAERIVLSGLAMLRQEWVNHHQVGASYHARTGRVDDILQDLMAPDGLLLGALGLGLLIDVETWDGMRLGNLSGVEMAVHGLALRGDRYDLSSGAWGFSAHRNGKPWLDTDRPALLRNLVFSEHEVSLHAKMLDGGPLTLRFYGFAPRQHVSVVVNGKAHAEVVSTAGRLQCRVDLPPAPEMGSDTQGMVR